MDILPDQDRRRAPRPAASGEPLDPLDARFHLNRELSLLEFDRRVLEQAKDPAIPLLERLRFLSICSRNLDEFFEIRVAGLKQQVAYGVQQTGSDGASPLDVLQRVSIVAHELVAEQYRILHEDLLPALAAQGVRLLKRSDWTPEQQRWVKRFFRSEILPILTPISLDPAHPFPLVLNKGLSFLIAMEGRDAFGRSSGTAVIQVPRFLPRVIGVPPEIAEGPYDFVLLSSVIHARADDLFSGMRTTGCFQFRVTRNSDLWVDEEEAEDLMQALKGELPGRKYGDPVRLEVVDEMPAAITSYLLARTALGANDVYRVNGPVNVHRLEALCELVERPQLGYQAHTPVLPSAFRTEESVFEVLRRGDVLLHHPFESFRPVLELVRQAASDPDVLAIKQTLYRTDKDSPIVAALLDAARAGKEVTAVVELRARFDEEANIDLATRLQAVGVNVVYGIVGYKCHAKMVLVVRREAGKLMRYVHLGTGNYHAKTARLYTDFGLLTANEAIGEDVHRLFLQLTGLGRVPKLKKLLESPFTLQQRVIELIEAETAAALAGKRARIRAKMNSLNDPSMVGALYRASQAGVEIELVIRGVCTLRPGIAGLSETIRVRSVVGRFLEHARIYNFHADGAELVYCSSADWMPRNLYRRVEAAFPIEDPGLKARVIEEGLDVYLRDEQFCWFLRADGTYERAGERSAESKHPQELLLERITA